MFALCDRILPDCDTFPFRLRQGHMCDRLLVSGVQKSAYNIGIEMILSGVCMEVINNFCNKIIYMDFIYISSILIAKRLRVILLLLIIIIYDFKKCISSTECCSMRCPMNIICIYNNIWKNLNLKIVNQFILLYV